MKTLYLDCSMGAAGDMLTAALAELLPEREKVLSELNGLGIPGVEMSWGPAQKCGITGTHATVRIHGEEESEEMHEHGHEHSHEEAHGHGHAHTNSHTHHQSVMHEI